jgi:putative lipoic acid-binding regulatory protein
MYNLKKNQEAKVATIIDKNHKAKIDYPTTWKYKLIARDRKFIEDIAKVVLKDKKYDMSLSNASSKGKFVSMNISVQVISEEERLSFFGQFESDENIKYVL